VVSGWEKGTSSRELVRDANWPGLPTLQMQKTRVGDCTGLDEARSFVFSELHRFQLAWVYRAGGTVAGERQTNGPSAPHNDRWGGLRRRCLHLPCSEFFVVSHHAGTTVAEGGSGGGTEEVQKRYGKSQLDERTGIETGGDHRRFRTERRMTSSTLRCPLTTNRRQTPAKRGGPASRSGFRAGGEHEHIAGRHNPVVSYRGDIIWGASPFRSEVLLRRS
jgi:hypothetical protein